MMLTDAGAEVVPMDRPGATEKDAGAGPID